MAKSGQIWPNVAKYGQIWLNYGQNMANYGQIDKKMTVFGHTDLDDFMKIK